MVIELNRSSPTIESKSISLLYLLIAGASIETRPAPVAVTCVVTLLIGIALTARACIWTAPALHDFRADKC